MSLGSVPVASGSVRAELEQLYRAAVAAVDPGDAVRRVLGASREGLSIAGEPVSPDSQLVVLAVGKAAAAMAAAVEAEAGERIRAGLVITRDELDRPLERCRHRQAGHPVPDARSDAAAREALSLVSEMEPQDVLLVLLSGGASALLAGPPVGVQTRDMVELTRMLLASGADIAEMNVVRKHVSRVAGGRLALAASAERIEVVVVSDVPGDRMDLIGSGPFVPDPSRYHDACEILRARGLWSQLPAAVRNHLEQGRVGEAGGVPDLKTGPCKKVRHHLVASNRDALDAAIGCARSIGLRAVPLGAVLHGEARQAGARLAALARSVGRTEADARPVCFVGGGETTVTLRGSGRGGRNQELALAAAIALEGVPDCGLLAAGTDGSDGVTDAAGAFVDGGTVARGAALGVAASEALDRNDSHGFFAQEGGLFRTGPTGTNVMDLVLMWVGADAG